MCCAATLGIGDGVLTGAVLAALEWLREIDAVVMACLLATAVLLLNPRTCSWV